MRSPAFYSAIICLVGFWSHQADGVEPTVPLIVAHRGLLQHAPENTIANFRACLQLRIGFEFDIARTKDGHLVCIHDELVDRTTDGKGKVSSLTLRELERLDAGSWFSPAFAGERVPTVEAVMALVAEHADQPILVAADLKAAGVEHEVVRLAMKHRILHRLLFIGRAISEPATRAALASASPRARAAAVANHVDEFPTALAAKHASWVYFRFLPTRQQLEAVHRAKKQAFIAGPTVSGHVPEHWRQAAQAGMDGILTDYSLELASLLRRELVASEHAPR